FFTSIKKQYYRELSGWDEASSFQPFLFQCNKLETYQVVLMSPNDVISLPPARQLLFGFTMTILRL
ncbi:MAG TPA: hypothetical protein PKE58_15335, partial [Acidobacteriota bacterium]|nr:hypothetical protein [Acidobacteriota bacterium]